MHGINAVSAASDVAIAIALTFLLHRSRSGFRKSERIINRLILFTVNTGVLTGFCAILTLIFKIAFPNTFIYMVFYILVARSTCICLSFVLLVLLITKELFSLLELAVCNVRENSVSSITYFCLIRPRLNTRDAIRRGGNSEPSSNGMSSVPLGRINVNQFESKVSNSNSSLVDLRLNGSSAIPPRSSIPPFPGFSTTCTLDQSRHRNQA